MNVNTKQENTEGLRNKLLLLLLLQITIITDLNKNTKWKLITKMNKSNNIKTHTILEQRNQSRNLKSKD